MIEKSKIEAIIVTVFMTAFSALFFGVIPVSATQGACVQGSYGLSNGIDCGGGGGQSTKSVESNIETVIKIAMWAVGIISVVIIIFAGIMYATAAGDEAKVKKAKHAIIGAIVGLAVAILAWTITNFVFSAISQ